MKRMKRLLMWPLMFSKRLYRKKTYLLILLLIPLLVVGFQSVAQEDSGVVTIALSQEGSQDAFTAKVFERLISNTQVINYVKVEEPERAEEMVATGKADSAWIFPKDLQQYIRDFSAGKPIKEGLIRIVEREGNVVLNLTHEMLGGIIFEECTKALFLHDIRERAPDLQNVSDEELLKYYDQSTPDGTLFKFVDVDGADIAAQDNYLTAPLRGILAVVAILGCAVTGMYFREDQERGIFNWLPQRHQPLTELGYQLICALNIMAVVLIAMILAGISSIWWKEAVLFILYSICCALFGGCMRVILRGSRLHGALIPVLMVVMLVICPVFFDFFEFRNFQYLFPPTYYIIGVYHDRYIGYLVLYNIVLLFVFLLASMAERGLGKTHRKNA